MDAARPTLIAVSTLCSCFFFRNASRTAITWRHNALKCSGTGGSDDDATASSSREWWCMEW